MPFLLYLSQFGASVTHTKYEFYRYSGLRTAIMAEQNSKGKKNISIDGRQ
jgi:hypothetical protein